MFMTHKEMTSEECYNNIKMLHTINSTVFMNAEIWKRKHLLELKKENKIW